jgi:8-oxo-dGTP diphosphatase
MDFKNPRYKNQGIHVDMVVFTVDERKVKILLVRRAKEPFVGQWILPGGAVYNDESVDAASARELKEKTGLKDIYLQQFHAFGDPKRDFRRRMVSIAYLALVDRKKVFVLQKTPKTLDARWFDVKRLPVLAFDHKEMVGIAVAELRKRLANSNVALNLLPKKFTLPELHNVYEIILNKEIDRRNFRRKFLRLGLIRKTGRKEGIDVRRPAPASAGGGSASDGKATAGKPADYYEFTSAKYKEIDIF